MKKLVGSSGHSLSTYWAIRIGGSKILPAADVHQRPGFFSSGALLLCALFHGQVGDRYLPRHTVGRIHQLGPAIDGCRGFRPLTNSSGTDGKTLMKFALRQSAFRGGG